jgi:hypothetical protein
LAHDLRDVVLDGLDFFSCPVGQAELDAYARVLHGRSLSERELQDLRGSDRRAWLAGERRPSWICAAIGMHSDFPADPRLLARSDFPLIGRILAVGSGVVNQLWLLRLLCGLVDAELIERRGEREPLIELVVQRAELLLPVGIVEGRLKEEADEERDSTAFEGRPAGELRLERVGVWQAVAEDAFGMLATADREARERFAVQLAAMPMETQLFGGASVSDSWEDI